MENRAKNAVLVESEVLAHDTAALVTLIDGAGGYVNPLHETLGLEITNHSSAELKCASAFKQNLHASEFDVKPSSLRITETAFSDFSTRIGDGSYQTFAYYPKTTVISEMGSPDGRSTRNVKQKIIVAIAVGKSRWPDRSDFQIEGVLGCFPDEDFDPDIPGGMVYTILSGYFNTIFGKEGAASDLISSHYSFTKGWINHHGVADFGVNVRLSGYHREKLRIDMVGGPHLPSNAALSDLIMEKGLAKQRPAAVA